MIDITPLKQTKLGYPDGNCFATCIAMITGIPLGEIPNFASYTNPSAGNWWKDICDWLVPLGWGGIMITNQSIDENKADFYGFRNLGLPFIVTGKSPSGDWNHCVVQWEENGDMRQFDPSPSNKGILEPVVDVVILVPIRAYQKAIQS